jgi:hypothetical protein
MRAAASSIARGSPSRRRQISAMIGASASVGTKSRFASAARSRNSFGAARSKICRGD